MNASLGSRGRLIEFPPRAGLQQGSAAAREALAAPRTGDGASVTLEGQAQAASDGNMADPASRLYNVADMPGRRSRKLRP